MASFATNDIHGYCKAIRVTDGSSVTLMKEKGVKAERKWVAAHLSVNSRGLPTARHSYLTKEGEGREGKGREGKGGEIIWPEQFWNTTSISSPRETLSFLLLIKTNFKKES